MTPNEIKESFDRYISNEKKKSEMDEQLFYISDKAKWVEAIENRAKEQRRMFTENNEIIASLTDFLNNQPIKDFTKEQMDAFFEGYNSFYLLDSNSIYVLSNFTDTLLEYYHYVNDYSKIIILSLTSYIVRVYYEKLANKKKNYEFCDSLFTAIGYKAYFNDLSPEAKKKIFFSYHNLSTTALENQINMSYYYLQEMLNFYNSDILSDEDKNDPAISTVINRVVSVWFQIFKKIDIPDSAGVRFFKNKVIELIDPLIRDGGADDIRDYRLFRAYIIVRCMNHELTPEEGAIELCEYFIRRKNEKITSSLDSDDIMFYIYWQQYVYDIIKYNNLNLDIIKPYAKTFVYCLLDNWNVIINAFPPQFIDKFISHIFVKFVRYIDDDKEKEEILKKIVYQHHISTCIHINMVTKLSCMIAEEILDKKPDLFEGIWGYSTDQIKDNKTEILSYIKGAAYFHDIGKLGIGEVINQQTRKIMDAEFAIIKTHPSNGRTIADYTGILSRYSDVIEGHHKTYDGKFGYPVSFDNTASPVRPIIDLITICDCLDAATDTLGRNYHVGKSSDDVLLEIVNGGGTRYNPDLGNFIFNNPYLRENIKQLTSNGRKEELYSIYQEFNGLRG